MTHPITESPFYLLCRDLRALRDARQQQAQRLVIAKAAPVAAPKPVDWQAIAEAQAQLEKSLQQTAARATQNAVRDRLAALGAAAKAGQLSAHHAALYDVLKGRAAALGLKPVDLLPAVNDGDS